MTKLTYGIVGLGLMGGSFAKALRKYNLSNSILGYDHNPTHQKEAIELNLVDKIVNLDELLKCNVIILAIPVEAIVKFLPQLVNIDKNTTIIDFGSTKKLIVDNIPNSIKQNYIPAHPMTGTEKFGPSAAIDKLYENKTMVLCDLDICDTIHKNRALEIFNILQMNIVQMDSTTHDIHACLISHLPHAISYALANTVMRHEDPHNIVALAGGGFKDMSRIAKSSPNMWVDIFRQNRQNMLDSLEKFDKEMKMVTKMVEDEDYDLLYKWMEDANKLHDIL
jgi:prephenate dehydrogenase